MLISLIKSQKLVRVNLYPELSKSISRAKIKEYIKNGAHTVDEVSKDTGACTGSCHGFRCKSKIEDLIRDYSK